MKYKTKFGIGTYTYPRFSFVSSCCWSTNREQMKHNSKSYDRHTIGNLIGVVEAIIKVKNK